ncbi:unnamed protein product [Closterium sp. NIES-54]
MRRVARFRPHTPGQPPTQPAASPRVATRSLQLRALPVATCNLQPRAASRHTQPAVSRSPQAAPACCLPAACPPACLLPVAACLQTACCLPAACLLAACCRLPAACLLPACCLPAACLLLAA